MKSLVQQHTDQFLSELKDFLSIPSVSADKKYLDDIESAANFLVNALSIAGLDNASKYYADGNAIVYAEKIVDSELPTVLIYGHYDVQPADPIELWNTPPFEPTIKDGKIFARGACDDKSQVHLVIKSLELLNKTASMSCNVKVIFEGEEETGSQSLMRFVSSHQELLKSDVLLVCDTSMPSEDKPTLVTGLRGITYFDIEIKGAEQDLHSGMLGGAVINPLQVLCNMLAKLKNDQYEVLIPGFYDGVNSNYEPFEKTDLPENLKAHLIGETGFSSHEQISIRPSLDINGIQGGYNGEGPKTIIPAHASAKLSMRLVKGQDHEKITVALETYLKSIKPEQVSLNIRKLAGCNAVSTSTNTAAYLAAKEALIKNFSANVINTRIGGSIPIVSFIKDILKIETVLMGFGLDSDQIHAPNESFSLSNYFKGIETLMDFFALYSSKSEHKNVLLKQSNQ